jgi:hypothetical protein
MLNVRDNPKDLGVDRIGLSVIKRDGVDRRNFGSGRAGKYLD